MRLGLAKIKLLASEVLHRPNVLNCAKKHCRQYQSNLWYSDFPGDNIPFRYFKSFQASSMCMAFMPSFSDGVMSCSMLSPIDKITSGFRLSFLAPSRMTLGSGFLCPNSEEKITN